MKFCSWVLVAIPNKRLKMHSKNLATVFHFLEGIRNNKIFPAVELFNFSVKASYFLSGKVRHLIITGNGLGIGEGRVFETEYCLPASTFINRLNLPAERQVFLFALSAH